MITPVSWLERVPTYKDKKNNLGIENASYGLLGYPVLMATDILIYKAHLVPVGKDQEAHLELTHGQILYQDGKFLFDDVGSTNGSLVNIQKVTPGQPIELSSGDSLTLGRTVLTFELKSPSEEFDTEEGESVEQDDTDSSEDSGIS